MFNWVFIYYLYRLAEFYSSCMSLAMTETSAIRYWFLAEPTEFEIRCTFSIIPWWAHPQLYCWAYVLGSLIWSQVWNKVAGSSMRAEVLAPLIVIREIYYYLSINVSALYQHGGDADRRLVYRRGIARQELIDLWANL